MAIIFTTNNDHDYMNMDRKGDDTERTGVCMGAAATWCKFALAGNYAADPCSWSNLPDVKKLATEYVYRVNPYAESRAFLEKQLSHTVRLGGQRLKILKSYRDFELSKPTSNIRLGNPQVKLVLDIAGIVGLKVVVPTQASDLIVNYIKDHEGIYLMFCSGHYMAASSRLGLLYFYDNQNALYRCNTSNELYETIKNAREKEEDWGQNWYAYRCVY
ncbi:hypothetical protein DJ030_14125 [bacterium endosymbiont of Escarpia laminata]|nr:MAG: hypothetical protein DJ030_14125 [bacterium endosymbiont of Escarpia laminata]